MSAVTGLTLPYGRARGVQEPFQIDDPAAGANASYAVDGRGLRRPAREIAQRNRALCGSSTRSLPALRQAELLLAARHSASEL